MARSDDTNDRKRETARPKASTGPRKAARTKAGAGDAKKKAAPGPKSRASAKPPARPSAGPVKKAAKPVPTSRATAGKPSAPKPAPPKAAAKKVARPRSDSRPKPPRKPAAKKAAPRSTPPHALDEEQRIEDAKYQPRQQAPRLFEEERFVFPESYGQSRVRLLVKDPEWLFAHWDVDPQSLADLRAELGERASALSKLTLRVSDPQHGGEARVLLPDGARSWYIRADTRERSYRAELGLTLPSGEFRSLAESNVVRTPRTGPAPGAAPRRARYDGVVAEPPAPAPPPAPASSASTSDPGPWRPDPATGSYPGPGPDGPSDARRPGRPGEPSGGASDVYRR